jgi:spermidine synthase
VLFVLRLIVFGAGAVLMALEIVGSRVVAPQFGSSIFVWGSLISVFLAGLSAGYYTGGRLADRWPSPRLLASLFLPPAVWILALPLAAPPLSEAVVTADLGPEWGPLAITTVLFLFPSACLGLISPFAIRLAARSVATVGNTAGVLYAVSTVGSIFGTLGTAFFLIPTFGTRAIVYGLGAGLLGLAALSGLGAFMVRGWSRRAAEPSGGERVPRRAAPLTVIAVGLAAALGAAAPAGAEERILYEKDSAYHRIVVYEDGESRILRFNQTRQSGMYLDDPYRLRFLYTDYANLALVFKPDLKSVCFIGLGGGSLPKKYRRDYPSLRIDVAEIDPAVVDVAKRFFGFREDRAMKVGAVDGRVFLTRQRDARYDVVFVDAYYSDAIPFHMTTVEFLTLARGRLAPDGIVAWNIIGSLEGPRSRLFRSIYKTFRAAFPEVHVFPVGGEAAFEGGALGNLIVMGTPATSRVTRDAFVERARALEASGVIRAPVGRYAGTMYTGTIRTDDVPVLTDDYAPVDSLLHF